MHKIENIVSNHALSLQPRFQYCCSKAVKYKRSLSN